MDALFFYFMTIGAGLATGVLCVTVPALWLYQKIQRRKKVNA
jgi:hypothetical protein